jgi:hypothetical protein
MQRDEVRSCLAFFHKLPVPTAPVTQRQRVLDILKQMGPTAWPEETRHQTIAAAGLDPLQWGVLPPAGGPRRCEARAYYVGHRKRMSPKKS